MTLATITGLSAWILAALADTARDVVVGILIASFLLGLAILVGRCIRGAEVTPEFSPSDFGEPKDAEDLDDWLADSEPFFEFDLWERPKSEAELERRTF